jgi:uncharacterized protein YijF (DUF1287 family)
VNPDNRVIRRAKELKVFLENAIKDRSEEESPAATSYADLLAWALQEGLDQLKTN